VRQGYFIVVREKSGAMSCRLPVTLAQTQNIELERFYPIGLKGVCHTPLQQNHPAIVQR
jgi:hypothetical protein